MPKRVRFTPSTQIYLVPNILEDATAAELKSLWFTDAEFARMQKDVKRTIRAMRRERTGEGSSEGGGPDGGNSKELDGPRPQLCSRGLEHLRSAAHLEQRAINKDCVVKAVFDEQQRQWNMGTCRYLDGESIAVAARRASEWARKSATDLGRADERAAWGELLDLRRRQSGVQPPLAGPGARGALATAMRLLSASPLTTASATAEEQRTRAASAVGIVGPPRQFGSGVGGPPPLQPLRAMAAKGDGAAPGGSGAGNATGIANLQGLFIRRRELSD